MSIYKHSNQNKSVLINEPANDRKQKAKELTKKDENKTATVWEEAANSAFQFARPEIQV